jgi:hypothetical protein
MQRYAKIRGKKVKMRLDALPFPNRILETRSGTKKRILEKRGNRMGQKLPMVSSLPMHVHLSTRYVTCKGLCVFP